MDATKLRYNMAEISAATGIDTKTLMARKTQLMKTGEIPVSKGYREFEYSEVMKLITRPKKKGEPRADYIQTLKRQLQTDGFTVKK